MYNGWVSFIALCEIFETLPRLQHHLACIFGDFGPAFQTLHSFAVVVAGFLEVFELFLDLRDRDVHFRAVGCESALLGAECLTHPLTSRVIKAIYQHIEGMVVIFQRLQCIIPHILGRRDINENFAGVSLV